MCKISVFFPQCSNFPSFFFKKVLLSVICHAFALLLEQIAIRAVLLLLAEASLHPLRYLVARAFLLQCQPDGPNTWGLTKGAGDSFLANGGSPSGNGGSPSGNGGSFFTRRVLTRMSPDGRIGAIVQIPLFFLGRRRREITPFAVIY